MDCCPPSSSLGFERIFNRIRCVLACCGGKVIVQNSEFCYEENTGNRAWKGIFGIRDLTKIQCGIRENGRYLDGIRDLTALWEVG